MKYLLIKNKKFYKLFYKLEINRLCYKSIFYNRSLPAYIRQRASEQLYKSNTNASFVKIRQRCFITLKGRSVFNHFKVSRIKLRLLFSNNFVNGIKKR